MLRANYTAEEMKTFEQLRYSYPDERIMRRFEILWLHACGKAAPEIASLVKRDVRTVRTVLKNFQQGGIELVTTIGSNQPTSELEPHRDSLIKEFTLRPPASAKEAAFRIKKLFDIDRSPETDSDCFGQCPISTLQTCEGASGGVRDHIAVASELFAELEFDREVMEVCQEKMFEQRVLRNFR
jgi:transposase